MAGNKNSKNSGRVSTQQFHDEQIKATEAIGDIRLEMSAMELRIVEKINKTITDGITAQLEYQKGADAKFAADKVRIGTLEGNVEKLEKWDKRIGVVSAISTIIGGILGIDRLS